MARIRIGTCGFCGKQREFFREYRPADLRALRDPWTANLLLNNIVRCADAKRFEAMVGESAS
jgi:hypothetical protein